MAFREEDKQRECVRARLQKISWPIDTCVKIGSMFVWWCACNFKCIIEMFGVMSAHAHAQHTHTYGSLRSTNKPIGFTICNRATALIAQKSHLEAKNKFKRPKQRKSIIAANKKNKSNSKRKRNAKCLSDFDKIRRVFFLLWFGVLCVHGDAIVRKYEFWSNVSCWLSILCKNRIDYHNTVRLAFH